MTNQVDGVYEISFRWKIDEFELELENIPFAIINHMEVCPCDRWISLGICHFSFSFNIRHSTQNHICVHIRLFRWDILGGVSVVLIQSMRVCTSRIRWDMENERLSFEYSWSKEQRRKCHLILSFQCQPRICIVFIYCSNMSFSIVAHILRHCWTWSVEELRVCY